jgi:sugar lactone lactonase YvrE
MGNVHVSTGAFPNQNRLANSRFSPRAFVANMRDIETVVFGRGLREALRVREGGEVLQTISADRGCFACMLGGQDRSTLFIIATEWRGPENMTSGPRTGQVLTAPAPAPGAGWP